MAGDVVNIKVCSPLKLRSGLTGKYHAICHYSYNLPLSKDLMTKTIIFTSRFGFCMIKYKTTQDDGAILTLSRPGFPWIDKEEEYLLEEKRLYKRNIVL